MAGMVRKVTDQEIIDLYREIGNGNEVSRRLRTHAVWQVLKAAGIERDGRARQRIFQNKEDIDDIVARYRSGEAISSIAKGRSCSSYPIVDVLKRAGVAFRPGKLRLTKKDKDEIRRLYDSGKTIADVARATGRHFNTVRIFLKREHALVLRTKQIGPGGPHWQGGRTAWNGYPYLWVAPNDPLASMATAAGYVAENRLTMARMLGRPLLPTETVHHIDGDIKNNTPGNLQLRQGKHGKHVVMCCLNCGSFNIGHTKIADAKPAE